MPIGRQSWLPWAERCQFNFATVLNGLAIVAACGRAENRIRIILATFRACSNGPFNIKRADRPPFTTISDVLQKIILMGNTAAPIVLRWWKALTKGEEVAGCKKCFYRTDTSVTPHPITGLPHGIAALKCNASGLTWSFARRDCFDLFL